MFKLIAIDNKAKDEFNIAVATKKSLTVLVKSFKDKGLFADYNFFLVDVKNNSMHICY